MSTLVKETKGATQEGSITIRPYTETSTPNMGLEKYDMVVFEGVVHEEQLACLEYNGIKRYLTGLNEFAPEIKMLNDEAREAAVKQIRITVASLEKELASNVIDPSDKEFWNKVVLLRPDNDEFWGKIVMRFGNKPLFLNPAKDPYDLIKMKAIEAGGFSLVAKTLQDARANGKFKFYLDKFEDTVTLKTELKKLRNKALAQLQNLYDTNMNKLFLVCKVIDGNSTQYKKRTPNDVMYDNMDKYINGETVDKDKKRTASHFLETCDQSMEDLKLRAMIKDAHFYKTIATRGDGFIYHMSSNTMLGKNVSDVLEHLKNPMNEEILADVIKVTEQYWNS